MALNTQPYKGARDFYPDDKRLQNYMFWVLSMVALEYGYEQYDAPILEPLDLFLSKSSEEIVTEQTYNFTDRGGRNVTLRPEMTPTVSRMIAGKRQELAYPVRWFSIPDLWRYERPQAGRLRQHYQLNVDIFGVPGIEADHEIIQVADSILQAFGAKRDMYEVRINSRQLINEILNDYIGKSADQVQATVRLIDHKAKMPHPVFIEALEKLAKKDAVHELADILSVKSFKDLPPKYHKHPSVTQLARLIDLLKESGVTNVVEDPSLMRGFDYYTDIVFEIFDKHSENNRSMFGGGRYDGLVGLFGVEPVPTVGFGMGDVTLLRFLELHHLLPQVPVNVDARVIIVGDVYEKSQKVLGFLRSKLLRLAVDSSGRKVDAQIKAAVKSGVTYALFIGEQELETGKFKLRDLRSGTEEELDLDGLVRELLAKRNLKITRK